MRGAVEHAQVAGGIQGEEALAALFGEDLHDGAVGQLEAADVLQLGAVFAARHEPLLDAAFGVAATMAVIYLVRLSQKNPIALQFDQLIYRVILFGFFLLTIGVVLGAVWANESWGSYWSWDPKETWSLITWFVYAGYLHATRTRGWIGKPAAILVLVGFAVTLFCYLGVNLVLSGLHSYGEG